MEQYLLFALLGLGSGAVYAAVAQGLVLMHRASGVINFAHGALAMYAIYVYVDLRNQGRLILPIPGVPDIAVGTMSFVPAFLIAVGLTALLGAMVYLLVFRHLETAPVLANIVATVGLLLAISGHIHVQFPSESAAPLFVEQILPDGTLDVAGSAIGQDRFWLAGLALLTAAGLSALYRFTTFGLATRARAGSPKGAMLIGRNPRRVALGNWVLASALAGVFGVLVAPLLSIDPDSVILLVVPSLAAAMLARFKSFWIACIAGLALGMAESELLSIQTNNPWLPRGLQTIAPLLVIIVVAYLRGNRTVRRDDLREDRLPFSPSSNHVGRNALIGLALGVAALMITSGNIRLGLIISLISVMVCLSMVLLTGYLGQVSLMQITFTGLAGLLVSALASSAGVPFPISPLLAAGAAALLGLLVGIPALRVRGTSLAVVTLSAAVATEQLVFNNSALTGGVEGTAVPAPKIAGIDFNILGTGYPRLAFGIFVLAILILVAVAIANLRRSPSGLRMLAVRMNERAAASDGINVARTKLMAFTLAAFIAGIGGTLFAYQEVRFSTSSFGVLMSLTFLAWAYLGGITSVTGAVIAGLVIPGGLATTVGQELIPELKLYETALAGVLVMFNSVIQPQGAAGPFVERQRRSRSRPSRLRRKLEGVRSRLPGGRSPGEAES